MKKQSDHPEAKIWDEITKALSFNMTHRLLPVLQEAYGKHYPPGTPIQLLATEHSTYLDDPSAPLSSKMMDIAVLVNGTDYYHIESQMDNDHQMIIRMIAYDLHFAILHSTETDAATGELTLNFPRSVVIYPEKNDAIPERLQCRLLFADGSQHLYQIPTVRIQTYSLEEIARKHLDFFIPFTLLRFRPRLMSKTNPLTPKELTEFVRDVILILKEELAADILTKSEYSNYVDLLQRVSAHIFHENSTYHEEVVKVTKPTIKLLSEIQQEEHQELLLLRKQKEQLLEDQTRKDAYIAELEAKLAALQT